MATFKLKLVVFTLLLAGMLFVNLWVGPASNLDRIPGGPVAALADPLTEEETKAEAQVDTPTHYQTWQELAYLSVLFERLANTYRGLEKAAVGENKYLIKPSGDNPEAWWLDRCDPPWCTWNTKEFAICADTLKGKVGDVFDRVIKGIAAAEKLLGPNAPFGFPYTKLYMPGDTWLKPDTLK